MLNPSPPSSNPHRMVMCRLLTRMQRTASCALWLLTMALCGATLTLAAEPVVQAKLVIDSRADSYPLSQALLTLEDASGALTIDAVSGAAYASRFRPALLSNNEINFGYSHSAYWLALPLDVAADTPSQWLLEIDFPSLDRVEVYVPQRGGGYDMSVAGDLQPFSERPYAHRNLVFPLRLAPGVHTLYLRVRSEGTLTIPATLWQPEALHRHDQGSYATLSVYYGMLLALLLYNLLLYFSTREPVFIYYVAFVTSMAIGQASDNGLGNQFLWPQWPSFGNIALPSGMAATGCFGALFTRVFFTTWSDFPRLNRILLLLAAIFALGALSPLVVPYQFAAISVSLGGLVGSLIFAAAGVYCLSQKHPGARYYLIAWTTLLIGAAVLAARNLAWLPTNALTLHAMQIGSALEMLLLSFALADRLNVMRRAKDLATQEAMDTKQKMVDALRVHETELESRVAQRTTDLERANLRLRDKEKELEHLARHDALTGLANRALLDERLLQVLTRAQRNNSSAALLVVDLDEFKTINDTHGHAAGDQLLLAVAERLTSNVRAVDTVARFGGDEFVIVMENLRERDEAVRIAQKLVTEIGNPYRIEAGIVHIGASIGIAICPPDASDPDGLLRCADAAMYAAKSAGRNQWRAYHDLPPRRAAVTS